MMALKPRKIAIVGVGHVGSHCALSLATQGICDELIMIDIDQPKALAQATDLADAAVYLPHHVDVCKGDLSDCKDADLVVISAGPLPKPGQTRVDTLFDTIAVMDQIIGPLVKSGFGGILINISNPCDVITRYLQERTGFDSNRVIGTSTALDSARLRRVLSQKLNIDQKSIHAYVMGEHGESQMVPWSNVTVGGKPLLALMSQYPETYGRIDLVDVAEKARRAGWVVLEGKGSTEFGIGTSLAEIVRTIFHNERKILPVSVRLNGEYGQKDVYASVPAVLGCNGVIDILEIAMTTDEKTEFAASCNAMKEIYERIGRI